MFKKGIELSINFMVILIISISVFYFGVTFIYKLAGSTLEITQFTEDEIDDRIGALICEGSERICIGKDKKEVKRGGLGFFGVKIINVEDSQPFDITVTGKDGIGVSGNTISPNNLIIRPATRSINLKRNEARTLGIGIEVPKKGTISGTYIFDIEISPYNSLHKIYVVVP